MTLRNDTREAVGVALVDQAQRVLDCDDAFCLILGRTRSAVVGRSLTALDRRGLVRMAETGHSLGMSIAIAEDRSEAARTEEQLREQAAILAHAQQIAGVGSWVWYPRDNRHSWSPEAQRIYGISDADAAAGNPAAFFRIVHAEDREHIFRTSWDAFVHARKAAAEFRVVRPDGSVRWVRGQSAVELDENGEPLRVIGVVVDVTDRKLADTELREMTAMFNRAYEVAGIASFSVNLATRTATIRGTVAHLLSGRDEISCSVEDFRSHYVHEDDRAIWSARLERAYRMGSTFSFEHRLQTRDSGPIWIRLHGAVEKDELGFPERALGVALDVTEQRTLEDQLRQVQKLDAIGQLAGGIAHDFNNLLLVIGGNAQLARMDGNTSEEIQEIVNASERARELVRKLLTFSRAEPKEPRIVDLNEIVGGIQTMLRRLIDQAVDVRVELGDGPLRVLADPGGLEQVLVNLAVNARDAMSGRGTLTITTRRQGDGIVLTAADTGSGMDEHTRQRVFDPFFTTKERGRGTGLGLSTVYGIVSDAGGRIDIDTALGRGTTFTITLPAVTPEERLLVVQDDDGVRDMVAGMLRDAGFDVVTVAGATEALELLDGGDRVDAVVCESGTSLPAELRRRGRTLPTIYTSGYGDLAAVPDGEVPVGFVAKPFQRDEVASVVRDVLSRAA